MVVVALEVTGMSPVVIFKAAALVAPVVVVAEPPHI
jgi:hypothetical protein